MLDGWAVTLSVIEHHPTAHSYRQKINYRNRKRTSFCLYTYTPCGYWCLGLAFVLQILPMIVLLYSVIIVHMFWTFCKSRKTTRESPTKLYGRGGTDQWRNYEGDHGINPPPRVIKHFSEIPKTFNLFLSRLRVLKLYNFINCLLYTSRCV